MPDQPVNMLFISERFPPSEGGSRVYYYNLCKNYRGGKAVVLTKKADSYAEFDLQQNFRIIRKGRPLPNWKYIHYPRAISTLLWTLYLIWREKIDVVHCGEFLPAGIVALIMKKLFGTHYVYYVHGEAITWFKKYHLQYRLFNMVLRNADRIIAACTYAEQGLLNDYKIENKKLIKITPGVNFYQFDPDRKDGDLLKRLGLEGRKIILTIGRLIERKGQDTVIRAMPKILREVRDAVYIIAGRGYYEETLRDLAEELKVQDQVKFLGFVPSERLKGLYSICDVFVMINRDSKQEGPEGFGMVFTEASAAGKPVVGGRSGGTEDSIIDGVTGFRVDPNSVDAVADHVIRILKDDALRTTLGKNGRDWVERTFDWREKAKQLELVNKSILNKYVERDSESSSE